MFFYYSIRKDAVLAFAFLLVLAVVTLATGSSQLFGYVLVFGVASLPYVVLAKMGAKEYGIWERFQLTMPIKRRQLVISQYLFVAILTVVGVLYVLAVSALGLHLQPDMINLGGLDGFGGFLMANLGGAGLPLVLAGVLFLGGATRLGENAPTLLFFLGIVIAVGIYVLFIWLSNNWEWGIATFPIIVFPLMSLVVSVVVFVGSYFITARLYEKMDF